jgi:hypothetical protein
MYRFSVLTVTMLVALGTGALVRADDPDSDAAPAKTSWYARLWPWKSKAPAPKAKQEASPQAEAAQKRLAAIHAASALKARAMTDWTRRVAVCDRLREIAILTNDDELRRKADQLDQRAFAMYQQSTDNLPAASSASQADERILERRLGAGTGTGQSLLSTPSRGNSDQASIREVRP